MKRTLIVFASMLLIALALVWPTVPTSQTAKASPDSACGECMRAAAEDHKNCLQGGMGSVEYCRQQFEQAREFCRATACAKCNPEVEMCPLAGIYFKRLGPGHYLRSVTLEVDPVNMM